MTVSVYSKVLLTNDVFSFEKLVPAVWANHSVHFLGRDSYGYKHKTV